MNNNVFIDTRGIVVCQVIGDQTEETVQAMGVAIDDLLKQLQASGKTLLILDDITRMGKVPQRAQHYVVRLTKTLRYDRLAMVGNGGLLQLGANLLLRASGRSRKTRFFTSHDEARAWLLQKD